MFGFQRPWIEGYFVNFLSLMFLLIDHWSRRDCITSIISVGFWFLTHIERLLPFTEMKKHWILKKKKRSHLSMLLRYSPFTKGWPGFTTSVICRCLFSSFQDFHFGSVNSFLHFRCKNELCLVIFNSQKIIGIQKIESCNYIAICNVWFWSQ